MGGAHLHSACASAGLATQAMTAASALRATSGQLKCPQCCIALDAALEKPMTSQRHLDALAMPCILRGSCLEVVAAFNLGIRMPFCLSV